MKLVPRTVIVATSLVLGAVVAAAVAVPSQAARWTVVVLVLAGGLPILIALLIRHMLRLGRSEMSVLATRLDERLSAFESQLEAHGAALHEARDDAHNHARLLGNQLDDSRVALADQAAEYDRAMAALTTAVQSLTIKDEDQRAATLRALSSSTSAVLVSAGLTPDAVPIPHPRQGQTIATIDIDGDADAAGHQAVGPADVDSVVAVAGTLTDLRRLAGRVDHLPKASRVLVVVLRSTRSLPLPALSLPAHSAQVTGWKLHRGRGNGWTCEVSFARPTPAAEVIRSLARLAWAPPVALPAPVPATAFGLDIHTINPIGFRTDPGDGVAALAVPTDGQPLEIRLAEQVLVGLPRLARLTEADVAALRQVRAVLVDWYGVTSVEPADRAAEVGTDDPAAAALGLAMAGVPLCSERIPPTVRRLLGADLANLISAVDVESLKDPLVREEYSVRLRREALRQFASLERGQRTTSALSVLLCTRRPDMITHALEQLAGQRGVNFEVLLGLHGIDADVGRISDFAASKGMPCSIVHIPAEVVFGAALNRLAARASGSLVAKVDDDDWYGPDHLFDLILARTYSRADLVGCTAEFVYLEELHKTIRRARRSEVFNLRVSGGAMVIDRTAFEAVGGYRAVAVGEDQLIQRDIVDAGGVRYRTHGLGYVLTRRAVGHTWDVDADYFQRDAAQSWPGLHFTALFAR